MEPSATATEDAMPSDPVGPRGFALVVDDGREPPASLKEADARAAWIAISALWHPGLLAGAPALPVIEDADSPSPVGPGHLRLVAEGATARLPSGYLTQAEDLGCPIVETEGDRDATIARLLDRAGRSAPHDEESRSVARDFLALGTACWWLRDLTLGMGHVDCLDHDNLAKETLGGAKAWRDGDLPTARNRLRAAFELLTQARERFYPVDAYLLDLAFLDPSAAVGALDATLAATLPFTLIAPARALEELARRDPAALTALRAAIQEGRADVAGGTYAETDETLRPIESIAWQYRKGSAVYREHLDTRDVETFARRRFGLGPYVPALARRFGLRFALHLGFDDGRFPVPRETKRLWEGIDGSSLEALARPPLDAGLASSAARLAWRLAKSMKEDHVAVVPLVRWPDRPAPWFEDFRRVVAYSPVLARAATLGDFFQLTDRPYESFRPTLDQYQTPFLAQAVARDDLDPISRRVRHHRLRARLDGAAWLVAMTSALNAKPPSDIADAPGLDAIEEALETGRHDEAEAGLDRLEPAWAAALTTPIVAGTAESGRRPGYLVLNPVGVARRAVVRLPEDASADLRPEGPLRASQFTEEGVLAVVDLPAFGYAWIPGTTDPGRPAARPGLMASGRTLKNEAIEVQVDEQTGGLRSLMVPGEPVARLGQQLVIHGLTSPDGAPATTAMRADRFEVEYAGPALAQAVSEGSLIGPDDRPLARFHQRFRVWSGRAPLEVEITLSDLDPDWLASIAATDPWSHYLACRWAWPDAQAMMRRTGLLAIEMTEADRPETPDALDLSTRRQRTALLFGGLAHHRRHGPRMLDTLLIAGREQARTFDVAVALDLEHPFQAALDRIGHCPVVATESGPPRTGAQGWLLHVDSPAVAVTRVSWLDPEDDSRGGRLVVGLRETEGHPVRGRLRLFRDPAWARQVDEHGEPIADLTVDRDAVRIDLTPHELARIEIGLA